MENNSIPPIFYEKLVKQFRIIRFILLLWLFVAIGAFAYLSQLRQPFQNSLGIILCIIGAVVGGIVVLAQFYLFKKTLQIIKQTDEEKTDTPLEEDGDFLSTLKSLKMFCFKPKKILSGKYKEKVFNLYESYIYQPSKGRQHRYFLIHTNPISNFNKTVFIKPKRFSFSSQNSTGNNFSLKKTNIDTQDLFDIFTDNNQEPLPMDFINSLVEYGKMVEKDISLLITPKEIVLLKKINRSLMFDFTFKSSAEQITNIFKDYTNTKNLLDLVCLLEKK